MLQHVPILIKSRSKSFMKLLCLSYLTVLSWLLLAGAPARLLRAGADSYEPLCGAAAVGHFLGFALLAYLALAPRWTVPRWAIVVCLVALALSTELLQGFIPDRVPGLADCFSNLLGIAVGAAVYLLVSARNSMASRGACPRT